VSRVDEQTDRELERTGRRLSGSGWPFVIIGALLAVPGIVLIVVGNAWAAGVGIALVSLAAAPTIVGLGLLLSGLVSWWAARHKPFA